MQRCTAPGYARRGMARRGTAWQGAVWHGPSERGFYLPLPPSAIPRSDRLRAPPLASAGT